MISWNEMNRAVVKDVNYALLLKRYFIRFIHVITDAIGL